MGEWSQKGPIEKVYKPEWRKDKGKGLIERFHKTKLRQNKEKGLIERFYETIREFIAP
ncbi:hypothetical protein G3A_17245 [Bacillus sp. 17376]|nr:hypothetical protein G3A_17245 [Bacillus sp. 17376]